MGENREYLTQSASDGSINISEDVVVAIASEAIGEIEGVGAMMTTMTEQLTEQFMGKKPARGIRMDIQDGEITLDVYLTVKYGFAIPENAAKAAISSPLLETSIAGAHGVIINITSSPDIGLEDVETAAGLITQSAHPDANIIWGTAFDENLSDEMRVTVVATGFDNKAADGLRSTLGTAAAGTAPGVTASAPSAVFSAEVNTPSVASGNASAAKPVEEENSDTSYYDDLLAILNKRR